MSNKQTGRPYFRLRASDKERGEIANIEADIFKLPEELGLADTALIGVLDAIRRFYEHNPTLKKLEIAVVVDDA